MGSGTELGRVRGLGSARHGSHHWILQRVTALGNVILVLWFLATLIFMPSYDYGMMILWLSSPLAAVPMMLLLVSIFWHLRLGLQVLVEDYVDGGNRVFLIMLLNVYAIGGAALGIFAVAKIAFTGAAS